MTQPEAPMVELRDVSRTYRTRFGEVTAVQRLCFDVPVGAWCTLLGPSGCGKSTALRIVAGLEQADAGTVRIGGRVVTDVAAGVEIPTNRRQIGMVFQNYAVWPHLSVEKNVAYPLRIRKFPRDQVRSEVDRVLDLVGLGGLGRRSATELSGGQQQRVALARALVAEPEVLLLDEPLSNLDAQLRQQLQVELRHLQRKLGITTIHVTHDQEEALALSDELLLLDSGQLVERGTPRGLYHHPRARFTATFLGRTNLIIGHATSTPRHTSRDVLVLDTPLGSLDVPLPDDVPHGWSSYLLAIRPEDLELRVESVGNDSSVRGTSAQFLARVVEVLYRGESAEAVVDVHGLILRVRVPVRTVLAAGQGITVEVAARDVVVLTDPPGSRPAGMNLEAGATADGHRGV